MTTLTGRVAVVTGAARGLGLGIARELAGAGAVVYCADLSGAESAAAELHDVEGSQGAFPLRLDIRDRAAVGAAFDEITGAQGRLDIVVNNAGTGGQYGPLRTQDPEDIAQVIGINLVGTINSCAEAVSRVADDTGRIINIASNLGIAGLANLATYSASKAGVVGLTQALALELAPRRVTVNAICPGGMLTDQLRTAYEQRAIAAGLGPEEGAELLRRHESEKVPLGRSGLPSDAGKMAAWIASDAASFTTGAAFNLSGGETLY